ncbi:hypothetical protein LXL81_15310 [Dyadobacter sp. CY356]|nr:hypothetical protein [Dyadobacter sp. CY356]MCF0057137.1 hypothetical protein [Dyadobacter sp. CY356]
MKFFETATFPEIPFKLNGYMTVVGDVHIFIEKQAEAIRHYKGSERVHDSLMQHLRTLKVIVLDQ